MGQWGWRGGEQVSGLLPGWSAGASALSTLPGSLRAWGLMGRASCLSGASGHVGGSWAPAQNVCFSLCKRCLHRS